jgi:hypothetical protein
MTNVEALQTLDNIAAQVALVRKDALIVQQAVQQLGQLITTNETLTERLAEVEKQLNELTNQSE